MAFSSIAGLLAAAEGRPLWEAVLEEDLRDRGVERGRSWDKMEGLWRAMREPVEGYDPQRRSPSGLTGGEGALLEGPGAGLCPPFLREVIAAALKTGECNACMGRIAEGGCQAEVGSASGMAAAALVHVMGGSAEQMAHACGMALANTLGLVCDPVAGLVEVPCVKRNVMGAVNALSCAEMALSGAGSVIPCDEVIDAMRSVGECLPAALRETGGGGLAASPTGRRIAEGM